MRYVVGLVFSHDRRSLLLIQKTHPEWQKDRYNGPGGKAKENETLAEACTREVLQETDLIIPVNSWMLSVVVHGYNNGAYELAYLMATSNLFDAHTTTDEKILIINLDGPASLPFNLIDDLYWIIPMLTKDKLISYPVYVQRR